MIALSIENNLKPSVDNQDATISDIFLVLKCNHSVSMRLIALLFETISLRKESDSIYKDFSKKDPSLMMDDEGHLDSSLTKIIEKEIGSLKTIKGFLKLVGVPNYPFWATKWLLYAVIKQQQKFISSTDRLRTYIREHDVDAENSYSKSFDNVDDLMDHLS